MAHPICKAITTDIIYYAQRRLKLLNFGALIVNSSLSFSLHVLTFLYMTQYHSKKLLACWEFLPNLNIKMAEEKLHFFFFVGENLGQVVEQFRSSKGVILLSEQAATGGSDGIQQSTAQQPSITNIPICHKKN